MKSLASESKPFRRRNSRLSQAKRMAVPFQIQIAVLNCSSDAELFIYLIQGIRFGSWKVRHLNWALLSLKKIPFLFFGLQSSQTIAVYQRLLHFSFTSCPERNAPSSGLMSFLLAFCFSPFHLSFVTHCIRIWSFLPILMIADVRVSSTSVF